MVAERRITAAAVTAELDVLDGQEKVVAGGVVVTIGFTNAAVKDLAPREHEELAAYLFALLAREPVKTSPAYAAHRIVLGSLATELRGFAAAAGEPVGLEADLRAAKTKADEKVARARIADQAIGFDRAITAAIMADHFDREQPAQAKEDTTPEEPAVAPPTETIDDPLDYL